MLVCARLARLKRIVPQGTVCAVEFAFIFAEFGTAVCSGNAFRCIFVKLAQPFIFLSLELQR